MIPRNHCPKCGSIWSEGSAEHDWQSCACCGWSVGDVIDEDEWPSNEIPDDEFEEEKQMLIEIQNEWRK